MGLTTRDSRPWAIALGAYVVFLALVLLSPASGVQSAVVDWFVHLSWDLGVSTRLATQGRGEFIANALILVPVSALGSVIWPRSTWRDWTAWTFVLTAAVELGQGVFLPDRSASMVDVVANTLGGLLGAVLVLVMTWLAGLDGW